MGDLAAIQRMQGICMVASNSMLRLDGLQAPFSYGSLPSTDVGTCIRCIDRLGEALASPCVDCARADNVSRCVGCLVEARGNYCPSLGMPDKYNAACISQQSQVCRLCADQSPSYERYAPRVRR